MAPNVMASCALILHTIISEQLGVESVSMGTTANMTSSLKNHLKLPLSSLPRTASQKVCPSASPPPAARRAPRCQRGKSRPPRGPASAVSSTPFARRRSGGGCRGGRQQREVVPRRACATDFAESGLSRDACARGASSGARRSPPRGRVAAGAATRTGSAPAMRRRASSRLGRARAEGQSACKRAVWRV